jgi:HlyD family secretion protein
MKRWLIVIAILGTIGGGIALALPPARAYMAERNKPKYRTDKVTQGDLVFSVQATGTIQPVLKVQIGTFVSGPIDTAVPLAEFNQVVKKGDLLARIDQRIYQAAVLRDKATWATANAEVARMKALLQQAKNDERRSQDLRKINKDYISDSEMDQYRFARESMEAQLQSAEQSIIQAEAQLKNSELNLGYTDIVAPADGIIIDRKIDPGQTLAAQFQTPELFSLAVDMDKRMWLHANVVEADIGHVLRAKEDGAPVEFRVTAYEEELFTGKIISVRRNPVTEQTVVMYPVVVETENADLKLLPGMTAFITFEVERREDVLRIPGAALRYLPDVSLVREEDKKLLDGQSNSTEAEEVNRSVSKRVEANRKQKHRHVWIAQPDGKLKGVEVEIGISEEGRFYEMMTGELKEGDELVTGKEA